MNALDQLREIKQKRGRIEKTNKRKKGRRKKISQRGNFQSNWPIYIEPLTSRPPLVFSKSSESFGEVRDLEREIFETSKRVAIMGEGLEQTLQGFQR